MKRVLIIGAGITGLATAFRLRKLGGTELDVSVLEASEMPGGNIRTDRYEGCTIEKGPNGYLDNVEATRRLIEEIGLAPHVRQADPEAERRYLYRGGRLHLLPASAPGFFRSPLLSLKGRARVALEPFAKKAKPELDESVFDFASRRIGREAASILVDAMVSGVFAGDASRLSLASTFPKMAEMEAEHGGLVRAMIARMMKSRKKDADSSGGGPAGPGGKLSSFDEGLDLLPRTLARSLGKSLMTQRSVRRIRRAEQLYSVETEKGGNLEADLVFLSIPAGRAAPLIEQISPECSRIMESIPSAGLAVVALGFDLSEVRELPTGFGFLAPRCEGLRILGCLWDSDIFPGRAPEGIRLMRVMIGGAHDPEAVDLSDEELRRIVLTELRTSMGLKAEPQWIRIYRYPLGIAQYEIGHRAKLEKLRAGLEGTPGLLIGGSSYDGISMNSCIEKSEDYAREILRYLGG